MPIPIAVFQPENISIKFSGSHSVGHQFSWTRPFACPVLESVQYASFVLRGTLLVAYGEYLLIQPVGKAHRPIPIPMPIRNTTIATTAATIQYSVAEGGSLSDIVVAPVDVLQGIL
jgi:hypothetical protein